MAASGYPKHLAAEDERLVDLVSSVLVDANIHTDTRMKLYHEILEILRSVHGDVYGASGSEVHRSALAAHQGHVPDLLASVLVDPNLHTDARMRLHREIGEMLQATRTRQPQSP